MKVKEVYEYLKNLYPIEFAYEWDNVGFLLGREDNEVNKVLVCLDITKDVIEKAVESNVDLIISHHPIIFKSIKSMTDNNILGTKLLDLISFDISCICMHTNYDVAKSGMADLSSKILDLQKVEAIESIDCEDNRYFGLGAVGELKEKYALEDFIVLLKEKFYLNDISIYGDKDIDIKKVAILPGSGASYYKEVLKKKADIFITGDISHHNALDGIEAGLIMIDAEHSGIENIFIKDIEEKLKDIGIKDIILYYKKIKNKVC